MTREEAINVMRKYTDTDSGIGEVIAEAHKMAIKALEQEPSGDAISRQKVLDVINLNWDFRRNCVRAIEKLPPVNPQETKTDEENVHREREQAYMQGYEDACKKYRQEPKTGHWIMSDDGLYRPICDKCGAHPWKGYIPTVEEATEVFKYCPNCGCRMVEPQESDNCN